MASTEGASRALRELEIKPVSVAVQRERLRFVCCDIVESCVTGGKESGFVFRLRHGCVRNDVLFADGKREHCRLSCVWRFGLV